MEPLGQQLLEVFSRTGIELVNRQLMEPNRELDGGNVVQRRAWRVDLSKPFERSPHLPHSGVPDESAYSASPGNVVGML